MRLSRRFGPVLVAAIAAALVACSDVDTPMEPASSTPALAPSFRKSSEAESLAAARRARHEQLKRELAERKAWIKAEKERRKAEYRAEHELWKQFKDEWKKSAKGKGKDKGSKILGIDLLRCEPKPYDADVKLIGPEGGTLEMGPHKLEIPKGALAEEQLIFAEAPTTSLVEAAFGPEGLQFQIPAKLKLSYKGCFLPDGADLGVAYLGVGNRILELPPSTDDRITTTVTGEIGHFSRYAVHY